jgi:hypothetical protein
MQDQWVEAKLTGGLAVAEHSSSTSRHVDACASMSATRMVEESLIVRL